MELSRENLKSKFELGDWEIFPDQCLIKRNEQESRLEPKVMEVLLLLVVHATRTVKRDEILSEVWANTYGTDEALSRAISLLRNGLQDDSKDPKYIETIPKIGYRLMIQPRPPKGYATTQSDPSTPSVAGQSDKVVASSKISHGQTLALMIVAILTTLSLFTFVDPFKNTNTEPFTKGKASKDWFRLFLDQQDPQLTTIAVLPFQNLSEFRTRDYFSAGLTDEILTALSQSSNFMVVARNSADLGHSESLPDTRYALTGSVKFRDQVGDQEIQTRITARLVNLSSQMIVWSRAYDRPLKDILQIQESISSSIAKTLDQQLGVDPSITHHQEDIDLDAYEHYLQGRFQWKLRGEVPLNASIQQFEKALEIDPHFHAASLALANAYVLLPYYSNVKEKLAFAKTVTQLKSREFDSAIERAEMLAIKAFIALREWRWVTSETLFRESLQLDPNSANTYLWYSQFLSSVNRNEDALIAAERAHILDSTSPVINDRLAVAQLWLSNNKKAERLFNEGVNLGFVNRVNPAYLNLLIRTGKLEQARNLITKMHQSFALNPETVLDNFSKILSSEYTLVFDKAMDQAIKEKQLLPRLELGFWMIRGNYGRVIDTIKKYQGERQNIDVEFLFAEESSDFRESEYFSEARQLLGLDTYWDNEQ